MSLRTGLCVAGVRGERGEPGPVRAGDQVPAAALAAGCRYLGNGGGIPAVPPSRRPAVRSCSSPPTFCQVSKTLKATLAPLLDSVSDSDCNPAPDVAGGQSHEPLGGGPAPKVTLAKRRANQQETEGYYFTVSPPTPGLASCASNPPSLLRR